MDLSVKIEGLDRIDRATREVQASVEAELKKGVYAAAQRVESEAKKSIADGQKSGRLYKRGGVTHRASAPGEAPASDTGALLTRGFRSEVDADKISASVIVKTTGGEGSGLVNYARALEFGTSNMAARPFLFPALEKSKAWITERLAKAVRIAAAKSVKR